MNTQILLTNHLVDLPTVKGKASTVILGTLTANLLHYGFVLSKDAYVQFTKTTDKALKTWWADFEPVVRKFTGDDKQMDRFVVYKNFPKEVLEMSQAQYWVSQILMYWGLPNELFAQIEQPRDKVLEQKTLKVLQLARPSSLQEIFTDLIKAPARWTILQCAFVMHLSNLKWDVTQFVFKENMAQFIGVLMQKGIKVKMTSATDVLRLAIGLSGGDVSMRENSKFKKFKRSERRYLLELLNGCSALSEDAPRDKERWKKFLSYLHPKDYPQFKRVNSAYSLLYGDHLSSFNAKVENSIKREDTEALVLLVDRPGDFMRRFHHLYDTFGNKAVTKFISVMPRLTTAQLLKIESYLNTINYRDHLTIAPLGNWTKLQVLKNEKSKIADNHLARLNKQIKSLLSIRIKSKVGSVNLQDSAKLVKLQTNDAELATFGRGTVFPIPDNINFIRSASYWRQKTSGYSNVWFDNGWNFFDADWHSVDTLCWSHTNMGGAAVFSGDPTNTKDSEGRACQMIDLYLDKLAARGIRYGVWNILCYSGVKFKDSEVFAALQWGEDAQKGKLFEASRAQFVAPVAGDSLTKFILYLDVKERKVVYMDANFRGSTRSAGNNGKTLSELMPAFVEYLDTLPSVHDLFRHGPKNSRGKVITYTDKDLKVGSSAYVFKPANETNKYKQIDLNSVLS